MPLFARSASLVLAIVAFAFLVAASNSANAKTYRVPPPGSAKQNNATLNILDVIREIRKKGFLREARQLQKLLNDGRIFYRTTGKNRLDAQFVHGLLPGEKDKLYFGVQHIKFIKGKGTQRFNKSDDDRRLALFVLTAMHEMIHKDQGPASIASSEIRAGARGYKLHEIEAYRASMKKYARKLVVADINDFLKNRGAMNDQQKLAELARLRAQLWALDNSLGAPAKYGDKACRWNAIRKKVGRLRNDLDALWLDLGSRRSCRPNLAGSGSYRQAAIDSGILVNSLGKKIALAKRTIGSLVTKRRARKKTLARLQRKLSRSRRQSKRLELADKIGVVNNALRNIENQLAAARLERDGIWGRLKRAKAKRKRAKKLYADTRANYDSCRIDYIKSRMKRYKLSADRLPPDMVKTKSGGLKIVAGKKRRKIDLKKALDAIKDMFNYEAKLLSATGALASKDPRTPCYKPPKAKKKNTSGKTAAKPKVKCRRSGLVGAMNCVTKRIERGR